MKRAILFIFILATCISYGQHADVFLGSMDKEEGGIYYGKFDSDKGQVKDISLATSDPSNFMALHPNGKILYSATKINGETNIAAYNIIEGGNMVLLNAVENPIGNAAHLSVHPSGKFLITAHYGAGSTVVFPLDTEGQIEKYVAVLEHQVIGANKKLNRNGSHPHWTGFSPDGRFAFVPDLGLDEVFVYRVLSNSPFLELHQRFATPEGAGPRHMRFSVDGRFAFVLNEITMSITTYGYDAESGKLKMLKTTKTLAEDEVAKNDDNRASEILVHPNGKYVYSANRGHDSVTTFELDEKTGGLKVIQVEPVRGAWPRNINLDKSGKWLFAAGMHSNTLAVFSIDQQSGKLKFTMGNVYSVPDVRCILTNK